MTAVHVFGLTGGIGSGKSTVSRHLRRRGLPLVDADELARAAVARGEPALGEIAGAFGADLITPAGDLDRAALARRVFGEVAARARLEAIVHPRVRALAKARLAEIAARGEPLAGYEVPLLFETGLDAELRPVVLVSAPEAIALERAARRDGVDPAAIRARMAAQLPLPEKARRADFVIDNAGTPAETEAAADAVLAALCARFGVPLARYPLPA